jgi:uncharacterized protein HemX
MQPAAASPVARRRSSRGFFLTLLLIAAAFGIGYVPQWMKVRELRAQMETASRDLRLATLHRELAQASHEAQRNNFANATEAASRFFDECTKIASTEKFEDEPRTRVALSGYAQQRDEVMALLAAGDPAARERLAGLFFAMDGVLSRRGQ